MPDGKGEEPRPGPGQRPWVHPSELPSGLDHPPRHRTRFPRRAAPFTAGLAGTLAIVGLGSLAFGALGTTNAPSATNRSSLAATPTALAGTPSPDTVGALTGAVVHVTAWSGSQARYATAIFLDDEGHALTSAAALDGAAGLEVHTGTGDRHPAEIVGVDPVNGLAVLRVADAPVRRLALRTHPASDLHEGDGCYVVGADRDGRPRSVEGTVATVGAMLRHSGGWMVDAIEVEAAMDARHAGSAVLGEDGALIGVVVVPNDLGPVVVPAAEARRSFEAIAAEGGVEHAWLGVRAVDGEDGVLVDGVVADSPAADADIETGDRVIAVAGAEIETVADLMRAVRRHEAGDRIVITVVRNGEALDLPARLAGWGSPRDHGGR